VLLKMGPAIPTLTIVGHLFSGMPLTNDLKAD